MREWFLEARGITSDTLDAFNVKTTDTEAKFPYPEGEKTRIQNGEERDFRFTPGFTPGLFRSPGMGTDVAFIAEGETDTMRLWQETEQDVFGLSGVDGWRPEARDLFREFEVVYVILDNDQDYNVQERVDNCWRGIRSTLGPKAIRLRLPREVKDVCEFFDTYDVETLRLMAEVAPTQALHYQPLDLTTPPPPVRWLVNDLIGHGDVALLVGEPGIGKSWLAMALAVKVAGAGGQWLGHTIRKTGRVLYVDEENPADVVHQRMTKLGMTPDHAANIRYLHQQGIRLDRNPDKLLDEATAWAPELILMDSLTRFHTQDENNAGQIAKLFNDGINPLVRETGATLLLLHHVNKTDSTSAFIRSRGSGDIGASVDTGLDVRRAGQFLNVVHFKSRRRQAGDLIQTNIVDQPDGTVDIETRATPVF